MPKRITDNDLEALKLWLQNNQIQYKNMHRDFSDAVLLANLLKKLYPKLVEMHNYPQRSNTQLKLINWETINQKVLCKLGLQQSKVMLDKLSRCAMGAIEALLCDIMLLEKEQKGKGDRVQQEQEQVMVQNEEIMTITVNKSIGDAIVQVPQKMILYSIYEQLLRESQSKDAYIRNCQQKITHLENVLKLKGERIDELCAQLAKVSVRSLLKHHNLELSINTNSNNNSNSNNNDNSNNIDKNEYNNSTIMKPSKQNSNYSASSTPNSSTIQTILTNNALNNNNNNNNNNITTSNQHNKQNQLVIVVDNNE